MTRSDDALIPAHSGRSNARWSQVSTDCRYEPNGQPLGARMRHAKCASPPVEVSCSDRRSDAVVKRMGPPVRPGQLEPEVAA
jgi:hypothetical protein